MSFEKKEVRLENKEVSREKGRVCPIRSSGSGLCSGGAAPRPRDGGLLPEGPGPCLKIFWDIP